MTAEPRDDDLEALLEFLKGNRGFDFTGYKRSSLERRIRRRMEEVGSESYLDYLDHLEVHPAEFPQLFDTMLINVTSFFRDREAWDYLASEILPRVIETKAEHEPIRVWSAGTSSGEETYTIAMLLAEALGEEQYVRRVKIYATDVDDEALDHARAGVYSSKHAAAIPEELRERYFDRLDQRYAFRKDLRRTVIFGRNDLVQDAPISRVDLLVCRNRLIYFNAETQERILRRLNFALAPTGFLFLGRAEMLITHTDLFAPVDIKRRVFAKVPRATLRERLVGPVGVPALAARGEEQLAESAFDAAPVAQVVVAADGTVRQINRAARELLDLSAADVGCALKDLELSYRPVELRHHVDTVLEERRPMTLPPVEHRVRGEERRLSVALDCIEGSGGVEAVTIAFSDITAQRLMEEELERNQRELGTAYEELQATVAELETTNEELQSTNEELETTNEELQSTNEELETMNEELQSSNEELETMNDELRQRGAQLNDVNAFMEAILASLGVGVIVLDRRGCIEVWNGHAEQMWGLRSEEAEGEHLLNLDIGLPVDELRQPLRRIMDASEREELELDATDRRGRAFRCRVTLLPLVRTAHSGPGAVVLAERVPD